MDKYHYLKKLEQRFSDLSTIYHRQVVMGKTPRELILLVMNIKSILSQISSLRAGMSNKYLMN